MKVILNVPDEGYSKTASCALNLISTFLLLLNPSWSIITFVKIGQKEVLNIVCHSQNHCGCDRLNGKQSQDHFTWKLRTIFMP